MSHLLGAVPIKAFHYPFRAKVSTLLRAEQYTPRVLIESNYTIERKGIDRVLNNTVIRKTY